ncbi:hypothetical protein [Burkholderia gladioli]|uniref:hypothetical protein n=1 Tax=Burkholderia gladioli TaxID=28095 RepID=UPI0022DBDCDC|nr:hypothetical protein [Burkholderia gladioli]MDA0574109.1 hypothetical protein [Burkholderia gladioli]MDA0602322.1 hypothetical protein [Burkholderia gladioli]
MKTIAWRLRASFNQPGWQILPRPDVQNKGSDFPMISHESATSAGRRLISRLNRFACLSYSQLSGLKVARD